jgi:hypothetical protein
VPAPPASMARRPILMIDMVDVLPNDGADCGLPSGDRA